MDPKEKCVWIMCVHLSYDFLKISVPVIQKKRIVLKRNSSACKIIRKWQLATMCPIVKWVGISLKKCQDAIFMKYRNKWTTINISPTNTLYIRWEICTSDKIDIISFSTPIIYIEYMKTVHFLKTNIIYQTNRETLKNESFWNIFY